MRHFALLLLPLLFLACKKEPEPNEAAVHVQLGYASAPDRGCIVVEAWGGPGEPMTRTLPFSGVARQTGNFNVAVYRSNGWSRDVRITVAVRELSCDPTSHVADAREQTFDFRTAGTKKWILDDLQTMDEDGDGFIARSDVEGRGGSDCNDKSLIAYPGALEVCNGEDDNCDGTADEGLPTQEWFRDGDGDGYGSGPPVVRCGPPTEQYVNRGGDCADDNPDRHPNARELCNGIDDDCNDVDDDPFLGGPQPKGGACALVCAGTYVCTADGMGTECSAPAPVPFYADEDEDKEGAGPMLQMACADAPPPKMASNNRDCDDFDAQTHTGAQEVCDGLDNNCNDEVDEALSCGGTLKQVTDTAFANHDWRTVALGRDGYPVWVAGAGGRLAVKRAAGESFRDNASFAMDACIAMENVDWNAAWVNPSNGHVLLAGTGGWLAEYSADSCIRNKKVNFVDTALPGHARTSVNDYFTGIIGFETPLSIFTVSDEGWLYEWKDDPREEALHHSTGYGYKGIHSIVFERIYAGGTSSPRGTQTPLVNLHLTPNRSVRNLQSLGGVAGYNGSLRAVWMATASTIYSVGDGGLVVKGTGQSPNWERVLHPMGPAPDFSSVAAPPGSDVAYIVDRGVSSGRDSGLLHRLTRHGWARTPAFTTGAPDRRLRDIAMSSAGNFWIVGDEGRVYHFPEP